MAWLRLDAAILMAAFLLLAYWILARSCNYDHGAICGYGLYLGLYVWLPGHGLLVWASRERVTLARSLALGLPLGFAVEIALYLGLAALGLRSLYPWMPLVSGGMLLALLGWRRTWRQMLPGVAGMQLWPLCALAGGWLLVMLTSAARMYAPAPLWEGLLLHVTHHDWVYLISRAAEIKHRWPLEDPSMAGTPLSYHYFLLVHVAAASRVTGLEIPLVLLRLSVIPMATALLLQVFSLGRVVARSVWAGMLAVFLLFATGEVSWQESSSGGLFQNLFIQWLYVSPTFFFGMIFMGALLLWGHRLLTAPTVGMADCALLLLLAVAATGAKGTTVGPLVAAAGLWILRELWRTRRWSGRMATMAGLLLAGFAVAFTLVLRQWSGEGTSLAPLGFTKVSAFWLAHAEPWQAKLVAAGLGPGLGSALVQAACALTVFAGVNGVLLLGLVYAFVASRDDQGYAVWLGLVAVACILFGHLLFLDSHGESYLYLPVRLPLAVLTAAAAVALWRRWVAHHQYDPLTLAINARLLGLALTVLLVAGLIGQEVVSWWGGVWLGSSIAFLLVPGPREMVTGLAAAGSGGFLLFLRRLWLLLIFIAVVAVQFNNFLHGNRSGLKLWWVQAATGREADLVALHDGLDWIRRNTPVDAVVVASTVTPEAVDPAAGTALVDRTTVDKYYYYSALSERRLFVEGPAYLRDQARAMEQMRAVAAIIRHEPVGAEPVLRRPHCYLLIDRQLNSEPELIPPRSIPVFQNERIVVYELKAAFREP